MPLRNSSTLPVHFWLAEALRRRGEAYDGCGLMLARGAVISDMTR